MGDTTASCPELTEDDDMDLLDTLAFMMDDDDMNEPQDEASDGSDPSSELPSSSSRMQESSEALVGSDSSTEPPPNSVRVEGLELKNKASGGSVPSTMAELGLVLSDDEDQPSSSVKTNDSAFSAAFSQSKYHSEEKQDKKSEYVDPLEAELREMEARVKMLRENLAKKKKLDSHQSSKFSKLTTTPDDTRRTNSRTLSATEEWELQKRLAHKSELHAGDTDSEDEEDNRNPMEQRYNTHGREIKQRIAHESKGQRNQSKQKILTNKKETPILKQEWKKNEGALVTIGKAVPSKNPNQNVTVDVYSGIRIINPLVSQEAMQERMEGRRMVRLSTITLHLRNGEIEGDWATIGVLVAKGNPKTSQKGSQYCIWKLSDLSDCTKTAAFFLFGSAYKNLWKHSVGSVFGILNPNIMKEKPGDKFSDIISLSVFESQRVMMIGMSKDLGWCKGTTKNKEPCRSFVNKASCEFCVYHIQREYQKTSSKRADIQSSFTRVDPKRRLQEKVLGKDQVFYGGQLYTSPSLGNIPKQPKANRAKDLATLSSLSTKMKVEELKVKEKLKIPQHLSEGEASAVKDVAGKNEFLSEKLLVPSPGARNLLKHMVKEDTKKKVKSGAIRSVSAKELLDMTHKSMLARRKQQEKSLKAKSLVSSVSRPSLSSLASLSSLEPQLARGVKPGEDVDLDICYTSTKQNSLAMAKALELVKRKGGINAAEPNQIKNKDKAALPEFQDKIQKRLNTSGEDEVNDPASKKSRLTETVSDGKTRTNLGAVDINSDKFKELMNKKSRHSNLVNVVENEAMEKYYQGLEKREMLEEKLSSVMEINVTAYICIKCRYMSEKASELCKEENHPLKTVPAKKRFFECKNCKQRTSSLDKLPRKACYHCEHNSWSRVSMAKIKKGPKLDSEILSLRGDELKHYSASSSQVFLHI